ncbi:DEAD/DEAH box helicase [Caballeronia sp. S22]|uniref:DEAD/DEAH box helicase n=1 Tax=Caballeronia sp. S22 TaxID=3137182 RepID=UPI003530A4C1
MNFEDIPVQRLSIRVRPTHGVALDGYQPVFSIDASGTKAHQFDLRLKDGIVTAAVVLEADSRRLNAELAWGRTMLARLANRAADGSVELQIAFFFGECLEMGSVEIGVDEFVDASVAKIERWKGSVQRQRVCERLDRRCCLMHGGEAFFFLTAGPAIDEALSLEAAPVDRGNAAQEATSEEESDDAQAVEAQPAGHSFGATQVRKPRPTRKNSFCVMGEGIRLVATQTALPAGKTIFTVARMPASNGTPDRAVRLARGQLVFKDWKQAEPIRILTKVQMAALTRDTGSYLRKWDEFGELEGELLLKRAREFGVLHCSDPQLVRDGTSTLRIEQATEFALSALDSKDVGEVTLVDTVPDYLADDSLTFSAFAGAIERESERGSSKKSSKVTDFDAATRTIALAIETLENQPRTLVLSLAGEIAQIKRRMKARRAILEGRAANPQLGPLIEEDGRIMPVRRPGKTAPLTAFVRQKVFAKDPTMMQVRAIDVALNTPDIALIQGPPGTGKTTVIAAILERLNELSDKRKAQMKGQVLLTGFQHDAVENMIQRLLLNGLPVPKIGKRSTEDEQDVTAFEKTLENWCGALAADLRRKNPHIDEIERETEIGNLCLQYVRAPTRALAKSLTGKIAALGVNLLGAACARRAAALVTRLSQEEALTGEADRLLGAVRRIRVRRESFVDDGPDRAVDALVDLDAVLEPDQRAVLDTASLWRREDGDPSFLDELTALQQALLARFSTQPVFRVEKQNDEVVALAEEAIARIGHAGHSARDAKAVALAEFLAELENNPHGMIDAVSDYSFAFAATCQQSVTREMQTLKGVSDDDPGKSIEYEYVIVDEAARVSPRDLMIPMVLGKRIILVGDHRQLPHIIDDEVARQMEEDETGPRQSEWLKKSMFHYLFSERLKALEEADGVPRRVTLDKQYRMHPLLGQFISRNFYERFDPLEKFASGRQASEFAHGLPRTGNRPAMWLDVPAAKGRHRKEGTSWVRTAEAAAIARQLQEWMNCAEGQKLTFGVISFYKAQADRIRRDLAGLTNDDKKLRVGTVDSFQGMEFDVVFLSMVRTVPQDYTPNDGDREKQARRLFGHLCLYNRLNVAMSRQKKLLVVVGDASLLRHELAAEFVPGLVDFLGLCETGGGFL